MKLIKLFSFVVLLSVVTNVNAQLRVLSNGRVQVGLLREDDDLLNVTSMAVFGRNGDARSGAKLTFGDFGRYPNQGWNVFLGEYSSDDTDQLWLHGKLGLYLTSNGYANNIVAYYDPAKNSNFVFNTNLRVNGVNITSDARLKENVESLQKPLELLKQINGVSYTYNISELKNNRKQDESKFSTSLANDNLISQEGEDMFAIEKEAKNEQIQAEIEKKEAEEASRKRIGFLAQDIQKVLPELVITDDKGVMSIDYIGFIPLIVESIKEMQETIQQQNEAIENLQNLLSSDIQSQLRSTTVSTVPVSTMSEAKLYNRGGASISYTLPMIFTSAALRIYDVTGNILKIFNLDNNGNNVINVDSSEIGYGTFVYALFVDDKKVDTLKKFISGSNN